MPEYKGDFFQKPDNSLNLKYSRIIEPETIDGWGSIMTADELRRIWLFGNSKLVTMSGDQYTDEMLDGIVEQYTLAIQEELQHDILPVQWRHRPVNASETRKIEDYARWQELKDFRSLNNVQQNFYVRVRKPVIRLQKFQLQDPYSTQLLIDLLPTSQVNYHTGEIRSSMTGMYPAYGGMLTTGMPLAGRLFGMRPGLSVPNAFLIDHISGYDKASRVPKDLVNFIQKVISVHIYSRYGAGIVGGLANFSVSAGVIHESVGTTMSASIDGKDKVKVRYLYPDGTHSTSYNIPIGEFDIVFKKHKETGSQVRFEALAVNPNNVNEYGYKQVLDVVEHDASKKPCYLIGIGNKQDLIGITGDHSLFRIEDNKLFEVTGNQIQVGHYIAGFDFEKITPQIVRYKKEYRPRNNRVFDLSIQDWQNFIVNDSFVAHNTSAYFGADILQFQNELKEVYPKIQAKYTGLEYAIL